MIPTDESKNNRSMNKSKKISGAVAILALIILLIISVILSADAAIQSSEVEIRGTVADTNVTPDLMPSWNSQSFAGFFYDIKENRSTESMDIQQILTDFRSSRIINENALFYRTGKAPIQFKVNEKETGVTVDGEANYQLVGWRAEKWIAVKNISNKIAKLAFEMGTDDKKTLILGETWSMGSGYALTINAVDTRTTPRQVWFTLKKDGVVVDEGIGQAPTANTIVDKQKAVYYKTKTILGESDALLFTVYVDSISSGVTSDIVQFKYAWLIDESTAREIKSDDRFGEFKVRTANRDEIILSNENSINLFKNSETTLMGEIKFKVADSDTLRFYPFVAYTNPGTYEFRGSVVDANISPNTMPSWNAQTFAGFYYDLRNNRSTETLSFIAKNLSQYTSNRLMDKEELQYQTGKAYVDFKAYEKEGIGITSRDDTSYPIVGWIAKRWIAIKNNSNKIAKLAFEMDKDHKMTLTTGETWLLGSGYELTIIAINVNTTPRQVWFTLKKDGVVVDEGIGQAPTANTIADKQKAVYYKTKTILGESDALLFTVYVDSIFSGVTSDIVQFKYAWLIDESSAQEIKAADRFGVFEVREASRDIIRLTNEDPVNLYKNNETALIGNIKFKIADNDTLRLWLMRASE